MLLITAPCDDALGLHSGEIRIDQIAVSSSSEKVSEENVRLITVFYSNQDNLSWSPSSGDQSPAVEVTFDEPTQVTAIATQGHVISFQVDYVESDGEWKTIVHMKYNELTGERVEEPVEFQGSVDQMTIVKSRLLVGIVVSKIRIRPSLTTKDVSMSLEFFGCGHEAVPTTTPKYEVENTTSVVVKTTQPIAGTTTAPAETTVETTTVEVVKTTPIAVVTTPEDKTTKPPMTTVVETTTKGLFTRFCVETNQ